MKTLRNILILLGFALLVMSSIAFAQNSTEEAASPVPTEAAVVPVATLEPTPIIIAAENPVSVVQEGSTTIIKSDNTALYVFILVLVVLLGFEKLTNNSLGKLAAGMIPKEYLPFLKGGLQVTEGRILTEGKLETLKTEGTWDDDLVDNVASSRGWRWTGTEFVKMTIPAASQAR